MKVNLHLENTYIFENPLPDKKCVQCLMLSPQRFVLRYNFTCIVALIEHDDKLKVQKVIDFSQQVLGMIEVNESHVRFIAWSQNQVTFVNDLFEKVNEQRFQTLGDRPQMIYFRETGLLFMYRTTNEETNQVIQYIDSPMAKQKGKQSYFKIEKVKYLKNSGWRKATPLQVDQKRHIYKNTFDRFPITDLVFNQTEQYGGITLPAQYMVRDVYLLSDESKTLLILGNFLKQQTLNLKSKILKVQGKQVRQIYKSRYLIDKLMVVDLENKKMCVSFVYDGPNYQSVIMLINYDNGSVLQRFPTNFTTLYISLDMNYAYDLKRSSTKQVKICVRKLWSKRMLVAHLMMAVRVPQNYGNSVVRRVMDLLLDDN